MLKKLVKISNSIEESIIFLCIMSSLIVVLLNILLRYIFAGGFVFSEEYARYSMILLVYIGVSQAIKKDRMIKVDVISNYFAWSKFPLELISNLFSLTVAVILVYFGLKFTFWQYATGQKSIAMRLPLWIAYSFVPLGGFLMIIRYSAATITIIKKQFSTTD